MRGPRIDASIGCSSAARESATRRRVQRFFDEIIAPVVIEYSALFSADRDRISAYSRATISAVYARAPRATAVFVVNRRRCIDCQRGETAIVLFRVFDKLILTCLSSAGFRPATNKTTLLLALTRLFLRFACVRVIQFQVSLINCQLCSAK